MTEVFGITLDLKREERLTDQAISMKEFYCLENEPTLQHAYARAANAYSFGDKKLAQRIYDYVSRGWFMFASPVLSNAPIIDWQSDDFLWCTTFNEYSTKLNELVKSGKVILKGLPISCYLTQTPDTLEGLLESSDELRRMEVAGGGVGVHPLMRPPGDKSSGVMSHIKTYNADVKAYKQSSTRRGSAAAYLDIDNPEILQFIDMRRPDTPSDLQYLDMNHAVNIPDWFMHKMLKGEEYHLIDKTTGNITATISAREVWERLCENRFETGQPYMHFIDNANTQFPDELKDRGLELTGSNLCIEIELPTASDRSAVCCLSSPNLAFYDSWCSSAMIPDMVTLLDNVLEVFIIGADDYKLHKAKKGAMMERSLGIGGMGFHTYLQEHNIPFESGGFSSATQINHVMFRNIKYQAAAQSAELAKERGEPEDLVGSGRRNAHLLAVAPNVSSGSLAGVSPGIDLIPSNAYVSRGRAGSHLMKNPTLEKLLKEEYSDKLEEIGEDEFWKDVTVNDGSIQHIDWLPESVKNIFKTSWEIDPKWIVEHAAGRQNYICQGQSLNLPMAEGTTAKEFMWIHTLAWAKGIKGLYYLRSTSPNQANISEKVAVNKLKRIEEPSEGIAEGFDTGCLGCDG